MPYGATGYDFGVGVNVCNGWQAVIRPGVKIKNFATADGVPVCVSPFRLRFTYRPRFTPASWASYLLL